MSWSTAIFITLAVVFSICSGMVTATICTQMLIDRDFRDEVLSLFRKPNK